MKRPLRKDDAFLADVKAAPREEDTLSIWWLGQSGFLLQCNGCHVLLDPYLSDSLTAKYASTDKPHVRMTERVIAPERLNFIDVVSSSHNHTDHLDAETLIPLFRANPDIAFVIPEANRNFVVERLNIDPAMPLGVDDGTRVRTSGVEFTGLPAAHETIERDDRGRCTHLGYIVRFGSFNIYHSGDTIRYDGMAEQLREYRIDAALLPINGRAPERRVAGNLWGDEAARLAKDIDAGCVIPCHYDMFAFNTAPPDAFVAECERLGQHHRILEQGEGTCFRWEDV